MLKAEAHEKLSFLILLTNNEISKPSFLTLPIFFIAELKPVEVGNCACKSRSRVFLRYRSTVAETWLLKKLTSSPKSTCSVVSHLRSSFPKSATIAPNNGVALFQEYEARSEEHTSELQSREKLVCRL